MKQTFTIHYPIHLPTFPFFSQIVKLLPKSVHLIEEKNPAETHPFYTDPFDPNFIVILSGKSHLLEGKPNFMSQEKKFGDMIFQK